jgi:hypothetical protein
MKRYMISGTVIGAVIAWTSVTFIVWMATTPNGYSLVDILAEQWKFIKNIRIW